VPFAVDDDVVELYAVGAFQIVCGLLGLLQPIHAHRATWKVLIALAIDDIVALGNNLTVDNCFHDRISCAATISGMLIMEN
jgi:hypothetical protein